jgi:hypothetical protein
MNIDSYMWHHFFMSNAQQPLLFFFWSCRTYCYYGHLSLEVDKYHSRLRERLLVVWWMARDDKSNMSCKLNSELILPPLALIYLWMYTTTYQLNATVVCKENNLLAVVILMEIFLIKRILLPFKLKCVCNPR